MPRDLNDTVVLRSRGQHPSLDLFRFFVLVIDQPLCVKSQCILIQFSSCEFSVCLYATSLLITINASRVHRSHVYR